MPISLPEQFFNTIKNAERPVIVLSDSAGIDDFCAAFTLHSVLESLQKPSPIISVAPTPKEASFLPYAPTVKNAFPALRALTLHVDLAKAKVDDLSYSTEGDDLRIHVTPLSGSWSSNDVRVETSLYRYDLIIAVGVRRLADLGDLYVQERDFLHHTPSIVVDFSPENERFGHVNAIMATSSGIAEACAQLILSYDEAFVDETRATVLLTGIIAKTRAFRAPNINQATLDIVARLVEKGGKREDIVERLFRTRSVETLRLWGTALTRLQAFEDIGIVTTAVLREDFARTGAGPEVLEDIAAEIFSTSPVARISVICIEQSGDVLVHISTQTSSVDVLELAKRCHPSATGTPLSARVTIPGEILDVQKMIVEKIRG